MYVCVLAIVGTRGVKILLQEGEEEEVYTFVFL